MSTMNSIIFGLSVGLFIIIMTLAVVAAVNRSRAGNRIISGFPKSRIIIHYQIQGERNPLVMVVDESRNKDLQDQLRSYFGGSSVPN